jgi:hypothetical protein
MIIIFFLSAEKYKFFISEVKITKDKIYKYRLNTRNQISVCKENVISIIDIQRDNQVDLIKHIMLFLFYNLIRYYIQL